MAAALPFLSPSEPPAPKGPGNHRTTAHWDPSINQRMNHKAPYLQGDSFLTTTRVTRPGLWQQAQRTTCPLSSSALATAASRGTTITVHDSRAELGCAARGASIDGIGLSRVTPATMLGAAFARDN